MRKTLLTVAFCLSLLGSTRAWAQAVQNVVVKEYQEKNQKTPMADVGVTVGNAGSVITDADGRASLRFRSLKPGDRVQLRRIEKDGYEVFNSDAVEQWAVSSTTDFQLVLCRSDKFRQLREQYMRVASQSYDRQYQVERRRLERERKVVKMQEEEYNRRLQELEDQFDQQLEDLENYVDRFARIDLSELSKQEQELIKMVQGGKIDEAIYLYEKHDFLGQYERESQDIAEIDRAQQRLEEIEAEKRRQRDAVMASIDRQIGTYRLAGGRENFNKITALLKGVADADTTNVRAVWNYANHLLQQRSFDEANRYLAILAQMLATSDEWSLLADAYMMFSQSYSMRRMIDESISYIDRAIDTYRQRMDSESLTDKAGLARLLWAKNNTLMASGNYDPQLMVVDELRPLLNEQVAAADEDDLTWLRLQAVFEAESAQVSVLKGEDLAMAEQQALAAYHRLRPKTDTSDVTAAERLLSVIQSVMLVMEAAEHYKEQLPLMEEAVSICRPLYDHNPDSYCLIFLEQLSNLCDAYVQNEMIEKASPFITETLGLIPAVRERYGDALAPNEMAFYDCVASYYQKKGEDQQVLAYARLCLQAYELMPQELKEMYEEVYQRWRAVF